MRSFGARGDAMADDTAAIQAGVDALPPGGTLRFEPGTYRISGTDRGIRLKSDIRLDLGTAILAGIDRAGVRCRVLHAEGTRNVLIAGGTLVGVRAGTPEWGVGLLASDATDLVVQDVTVRGFYFDGILLTGNTGCRRVTLRRVVSERNRRSGLSVTAGSDVLVESSVFRYSAGQSPETGMNVEPNASDQVSGVTVRGSTFLGNAGHGLYIHRGLGDVVTGALVQSNLVRDNGGEGIAVSGARTVTVSANSVLGHRGRSRTGIAIGADTAGMTVTGNRLEGNHRGIVSAGATGVQIRQNVVLGLGALTGVPEDADGIVCRGLSTPLAGACAVSGNLVQGYAGTGILGLFVSGVEIVSNTVADTGRQAISLRYTSDSVVQGNRTSRTSLALPRRYCAIDVTHDSHDNAVVGNVSVLGETAREPACVGTGCLGNRIEP